MQRVVITGMGIYSTIGLNLDEARDSLYNGKSGIGIDEYRKELGFISPLTGVIERPKLKGIIPRRMRIGMAEQGEYAYISTIEALKNAKLDQDYIEKNNTGIIFGNDSSAIPVVEAADIIREKKDTTLVGSGSVFQSMNSTVTMNLAVILKLKGINLTISAACASGSHSIGLGYHLIKSGLQSTIICGGAQEINAMSMGSFDGLMAFSRRVDDPHKASRPFDISRDGLVPSGGAATVILESYESAIKRGAPILGEIIGYGFSSNGDHITVPNVNGPAASLEMSIRQAGITAKEIDYINAHATSTPVGDKMEAQAISRVFGDSNTLVSSTKSITGHEMWMGGASEVVYSLLMMHNSFIAPNINFETPDEFSAKLNIADKTINKKIDLFLSNSFGFGGTNSSLVIKRV
jgi:3-oxoacyl-[acyl-carrier-protein] synthase-1